MRSSPPPAYRSVNIILLTAALAIAMPVPAHDQAFASSNLGLPSSLGRITIATYNVKNFFDVFDNPYTEDETTPVKARSGVLLLADAITAMDADIVTFQELENEPLLEAFVAEFLPDMGYDHVAATPTNDRRGITLGIISRLPIDRITSYRFRRLHVAGDNRTWRFARNLVQITIRIDPKTTLDLFAAHLKSKRNSENDRKSAQWRLAEAMEIRRIIKLSHQDDPNALYMLAGDLNDLPESLPIKHLLGDDPDGPPILVDVHEGLKHNQRRTYLNKRYRDQGPIDYILASPALTRRRVQGSAGVLSDAKVLGGSDHAPVLATFDLSPATGDQ